MDFEICQSCDNFPIDTKHPTERRPQQVAAVHLPVSADINCPEGAPYQDHKRAVAETYDGQFICTGSLINSTAQDNRLLFITAEHCESWIDPSTLDFYWNYENSGCGTNDAPFTFSTGAVSLYRTTAIDEDINLLEIDGTDIDSTYNVYFTGWSSKRQSPLSAHP